MTEARLVTAEAVRMYEQTYGFVGIGQRMIAAGIWKLEDEKMIDVKMTSAPETRNHANVTGTLDTVESSRHLKKVCTEVHYR